MHGWADLLDQWPEVKLSYNIPPTVAIAAYVNPKEFVLDTGHPELSLESDDQNSARWLGLAMRWGMIPGWAKSFSSNYSTFNARVESVADKPVFRAAWKRRRRCLIPMAGYYEWEAIKNNDRSRKQPYYITHREGDILMAAGLYEWWNEEALSCTMLTKASNGDMQLLHSRQPVLLNREQGIAWLAGDRLDLEPSFTDSSLSFYQVSSRVGDTRQDDEGLRIRIEANYRENS